MSFLIGLISGIFGGLVGLGGGVVMIPLMTRFPRYFPSKSPWHEPCDRDFRRTFRSLRLRHEGNRRFTAALILAVTASLMARVGARYCAVLPAWKLKRYFGFVLLVAVALLVAKPHLGAMAVIP